MPAQQVDWPVLSGPVPPLADCHSPRPETGLGIVGNLEPGETVVLTQADEAGPDGVAHLGGNGKTQIAAALAHSLWEHHAVDLLLWVGAASRDAVVTAYAQALADVGAAAPDEDPGSAAARFLAWLGNTRQPWLLVLDDLVDSADLEGLWPQGMAGRVVVTTRQPADALRGGSRRIVPIRPFTLREALAYITARLAEDPGQRTEALDLATDLGCQPLGLAQATAMITDTGLSCREYRVWFTDRRRRLSTGVITVRPSTAEITWSLSIDRADQLPPAGLARPALALAAMLDTGGIPGTVLTSPAASSYIAGRRAGAADQVQSRDAVHNLARLGLATINASSAARTVQVHPLVQAIVRASLPPPELDRVARAAADALLQAWPDDAAPQLGQALRDCVARLHESTGEMLWTPDPHPVLLRAGRSLNAAGAVGPAIAYWHTMIDTSRRTLGPAHAQTFQCRDSLGAAYEAAGHTADAIGVYEAVLADRERLLGADHPDTLTSCSNLAHAYFAAGRSSDAIPAYERTIADREWVLGANHPDTLTARGNLAAAYLATGDLDRAIPLAERTLADREQAQGPDHPDTLTARGSLGYAYLTAGRVKQAIPLYERTVADRERVQGPDHPDTLTARGSLAYAYRTAGRMKHAIPLYERTVADRARILGRGHPDTLTARGNLANAYHSARRLKDAIPQYELTLAEREQAQGPDHPDTLTARGNLANAYHSAGRLKDALPLYERTLSDSERVLGASHPTTLTARGNLGSAYHAALRLTDAIAVFQRALADCEQALGPDHPLTRTMRENLGAAAQH